MIEAINSPERSNPSEHRQEKIEYQRRIKTAQQRLEYVQGCAFMDDDAQQTPKFVLAALLIPGVNDQQLLGLEAAIVCERERRANRARKAVSL